jgi:hypothetical protein
MSADEALNNNDLPTFLTEDEASKLRRISPMYQLLAELDQANNHHFASYPTTHAPLNRSPAILCH